MFAKVKTTDKAIKNILHCKTVPYKCIIKVTFAPYRFLATTRKNDINRNFTLN